MSQTLRIRLPSPLSLCLVPSQDKSGHGYVGTLPNGALFKDDYLYLNGVNQYINLPSSFVSAINDKPDFTIMITVMLGAVSVCRGLSTWPELRR